MHNAPPTPDEPNSSAARCHSHEPGSSARKKAGAAARSPARTSGMPRPEGPAACKARRGKPGLAFPPQPGRAQRRGAALPLLPPPQRPPRAPAPTSAASRRLRSPPPPPSLCPPRPRGRTRPPGGAAPEEGPQRPGKARRGGESGPGRRWSSPCLTRLPPGHGGGEPHSRRSGALQLPAARAGRPASACLPCLPTAGGAGQRRRRPPHQRGR